MKKLIVVSGINDQVIVNTKNAILVTKKEIFSFFKRYYEVINRKKT